MNCTPAELIRAAKCYQCVPKPVWNATVISLLCQWANAGVAPQPEFEWVPNAAVGAWVDIFGLHAGDMTAFRASSPATTTAIDLSAANIITEVRNAYLLPVLTGLVVGNNPGLTALDLTGCGALLNVDCNSCDLITLDTTDSPLLFDVVCDFQITGLTQLDITGCPISNLTCEGNALTDGSIIGFAGLAPTLVNFVATNNQFTGLDLTGFLSMAVLDIFSQTGAGFTSLIIGASPNYIDVNARDNALLALGNGVDACLVQLETTCLANMGTCDLDTPATNQPPTAVGIAARTNLILAGWAVVTN